MGIRDLEAGWATRLGLSPVSFPPDRLIVLDSRTEFHTRRGEDRRRVVLQIESRAEDLHTTHSFTWLRSVDTVCLSTSRIVVISGRFSMERKS